MEREDWALEKDTTGGKEDPPAADKMIPNVVLLQAVAVTELIGGLPEGRDILKRVVGNRDDCYHVLEPIAVGFDALRQGPSALGIHLKRYFTGSTEQPYR